MLNIAITITDYLLKLNHIFIITYYFLLVINGLQSVHLSYPILDMRFYNNIATEVIYRKISTYVLKNNYW